jgi:glutaredoxin 3
MTIEIYTRGACQYSAAAKRLLDKRQQPYKEFEMSDGLAQDMMERTGQSTTPIVFLDGTHIGGFDELVDLDQDGKL